MSASSASSAQKPKPRVSVVIATYNRRDLVERLLLQLATQTLPPAEYEVVVVDDGSKEPVGPYLKALKLPYTLTVEAQQNAGAAAARHRGAQKARGELLVITDDDMQVAEDFLDQHLKAHEGEERRAVLGRIRADPNVVDMPLFERWYAYRLDTMAENFLSGKATPKGNQLFTGNVSMRRADYLGVGGFDPELKRSEDAELGLRLEASGVRITFSDKPYTLHGSDHTNLEVWLRRAFLYGIFDSRIYTKHPEARHANPWRFVFRLNPLARPLLALAAVAPELSRPLSSLAWTATRAADQAGLTKLAYAGSAVVYTMEYFRGVRDEAGSLPGAAKAFARYLKNRS